MKSSAICWQGRDNLKDEDLTGLIGQMDQLKAALKELAPPIAQFYKTLVAEGVPPEHALTLSLALQQRLLGQVGSA